MSNQIPRTGRADIHASEGWDEQFESILREHLPFLLADEPLDPGQDLRAAGLDSLGVVNMLVALESAYGVRLAEEAMTMDTFATPAILWNALLNVNGATELSASRLGEERKDQ
jgi:acyl carrier protein